MFFKPKKNKKINSKKDIILHIAGIAVSLILAYALTKLTEDKGE